MYDVIIIGAGPAGLMAAKTLEGTGTTFLVVDKKEKIGSPLKCGEAIRGEGFRTLFGEADYPFVRERISGHRVIFEDVTRDLDVDFIELDRPEFERWLAEDIEDRIRLGEKCLDVEITDEGCVVKTDREELRAGIVMLANGCDFHIQRKLRVINEVPVLAPCYGGVYKVSLSEHKRFSYIFDKKAPGYFWIFPKGGDVANIGYGSFEKVNIRERFEEMFEEYVGPAERLAEYGGSVPVSGPIRRTYDKRLMICGDAAGQVYAGTGEGIYYALKAGQLAALTAQQALDAGNFGCNFMKRYEVSWKRAFGGHMTSGIISRDLIKLAYRLGKMGALLTSPGDEGLRGLMIDGIVPKKVLLKWHMLKLLGKLKSTR